MKKILLLIVSIFLLASCSSAPTPSQQVEKVRYIASYTEFSAYPFQRLALAYTETAKQIKGFKRQISADENPYIRQNLDYDRFIYGELFYFNNINSMWDFIDQAGKVTETLKNELFPNNQLFKYKDNYALDDKVFIAMNANSQTILFTEYVVYIKIVLKDSPYKIQLIN